MKVTIELENEFGCTYQIRGFGDLVFAMDSGAPEPAAQDDSDRKRGDAYVERFGELDGENPSAKWGKWCRLRIQVDGLVTACLYQQHIYIEPLFGRKALTGPHSVWLKKVGRSLQDTGGNSSLRGIGGIAVDLGKLAETLEVG